MNIKSYLFYVLLSIPCFGWSHQICEEPTICFYALEKTINDSRYNEECMLCSPIQDDPGIIAFTKHWKIIYVPNQSYLGRLVIASQRHFGSYEEMNEEEAIEYSHILKILLPALKKVFNVTHFNVAYLMNMAFNSATPDPAFKNGQPNPHFHWHVIPRYDGPREFLNEHFEDPDFGDAFNLKRKKILTIEFKKQVIQMIRDEINVYYIPANNQKVFS